MTIRILAAALCVLSLASFPAAAQTATQQAQDLRYLDFTARNDGWAASQTAAIIGSRGQKLVIVSYLDPQTTRAFYDIALEFTRPPEPLPIFGVVRAPQHPTEPNANGLTFTSTACRLVKSRTRIAPIRPCNSCGRF